MKPSLEATFRANLSAMRKSRGWTYREMGERAGISGVYAYQLEKGTRTPTLATIGQIAKAFRLTSLAMLEEP